MPHASTGRTPMEQWNPQEEQPSHLLPFGAVGWVPNPAVKTKTKLAPLAHTARYLYHIYIPCRTQTTYSFSSPTRTPALAITSLTSTLLTTILNPVPHSASRLNAPAYFRRRFTSLRILRRHHCRITPASIPTPLTRPAPMTRSWINLMTSKPSHGSTMRKPLRTPSRSHSP